MEKQEFENIMDTYNRKLEMALSLNLQCLEAIQSQKVKSKIKSLIATRIFGITLGIIWVLFLGVLFCIEFRHLFFSISVGIILLITLLALGFYVRDLVLISQITQSESITDTQSKLAQLQLSIIKCARVSFLQLPFYCTFFLSKEMLLGGGVWLFTAQLAMVSSFTFLALWLYKNISYKNLDKKWLRFLLGGSGGRTVEKAISFIKEIDEFKSTGIA